MRTNCACTAPNKREREKEEKKKRKKKKEIHFLTTIEGSTDIEINGERERERA